MTQDKMTERDAALLLELSVRTLQRHRAAGTGPAYTVVSGRWIRYAASDLLKWDVARRVKVDQAA